jgi:hypothetical protein
MRPEHAGHELVLARRRVEAALDADQLAVVDKILERLAGVGAPGFRQVEAGQETVAADRPALFGADEFDDAFLQRDGRSSVLDG